MSGFTARGDTTTTMETSKSLARQTYVRRASAGYVQAGLDQATAIKQAAEDYYEITDTGVGSEVRRVLVLEPPEFEEHKCWMHLAVWPDDVDDTLPGRSACMACGRIFRIELEATP